MIVGITNVGANEVEFRDLKDDLDAYQDVVGGQLEFIQLSDFLGIYFNEEGKVRNLEPTLIVCEHGEVVDMIAGECIFAGTDLEGFNASLTDISIQKIKQSVRYDKKLKVLILDLGKL